ncbi:hypothetical protein [Paenibacillus sp. FSL R7-0337]|uniref:hypothetical protein n=1 Tax=Paenibacillus sp. FSL R7-0337 TaxID=1926588 RepID=UPI00096CE6ED|nr:hypothetical protein [Paenibacillus sp. FSL R7-0337]OMG00428.1 hypothetical protein BK147_04300 [Paenibacillus sp. FSL R7-0337]
MTRSVKKTPVSKDQANPWTKRQASKSVRRYSRDIPYGKYYRKIYCSWNISDWRFYTPYLQAVKEWETTGSTWHRQISFEEMALSWAKSFKRK